MLRCTTERHWHISILAHYYSITIIRSFKPTFAVSSRKISLTVPSVSERISFSIFIATSTQSGSPRCTTSPYFTYVFNITPGIGA